MHANTTPASTPTLLILDDDSCVRSALIRGLRGEGYRILEASLPCEAASIIANELPGVIVSDNKMPDMLGTEFFARVRDRYPDTVRILLTAFADMAEVSASLETGAVHHLVEKPWSVDALRGLIRQAFASLEAGEPLEETA